MAPDAEERAEAASMRVAELMIENRDLRRELVLAREQRTAAIAREMTLYIRLAAAQNSRLAALGTEG